MGDILREETLAEERVMEEKTKNNDGGVSQDGRPECSQRMAIGYGLGQGQDQGKPLHVWPTRLLRQRIGLEDPQPHQA